MKPIHVEGVAGADDRPRLRHVIVHVFDEAAREYYDLEHLGAPRRPFARDNR